MDAGIGGLSGGFGTTHDSTVSHIHGTANWVEESCQVLVDKAAESPYSPVRHW